MTHSFSYRERTTVTSTSLPRIRAVMLEPQLLEPQSPSIQIPLEIKTTNIYIIFLLYCCITLFVHCVYVYMCRRIIS